MRRFDAAEAAPALNARTLRPPEESSRIVNDIETGTVTVERISDDGVVIQDDIGWAAGERAERTYAIMPDDPLSARAAITWSQEFRRDGFSVRILTDTRMTAAKDHFEITATLDAYEGDTRVVSKEWLCRIPRDHL